MEDGMEGPSSAVKKSGRIRKPNQPPEPKPEPNDKWTSSEKRNLLTAVKKYGWRNTQKLNEALINKSAEQIERFLQRKQQLWKRLLNARRTQKKAPIEIWLDKAQHQQAKQPAYCRSIAKVMSAFGESAGADATSTSEPDYVALYDFFGRLLKGECPTELSPTNSAVVLQLLETVATLLKTNTWTGEESYFRREFDSSSTVPRSDTFDGTSVPGSTVNNENGLPSSPSQMECDEVNEQGPGTSNVKTEHCANQTLPSCSNSEVTAMSSCRPSLEMLKSLVWNGDLNMLSMNPFKVPFDLVVATSAKAQQHFLKRERKAQPETTNP